MQKQFVVVFDEVMLKQFKKAGKNQHIRNVLSKIFDKLESIGPSAGKLLDSQLHIYEVKKMNPPIRLYYKHNLATNEIYVFEFEMKTSQEKQKQTIEKIKQKLRDNKF